MEVADPGPTPAPLWRLAEHARPHRHFHIQPLTKDTMDNSTLLLAILTICLVGVTFHAWRLGNEKRDRCV